MARAPVLGRFRRALGLAPTLRGRVSRVAVVKGGEYSVTVRFGLEELDRVRGVLPGTLLEVVEVPGSRPKPKRQRKPKTPDPNAPPKTGETGNVFAGEKPPG